MNVGIEFSLTTLKEQRKKNSSYKKLVPKIFLTNFFTQIKTFYLLECVVRKNKKWGDEGKVFACLFDKCLLYFFGKKNSPFKSKILMNKVFTSKQIINLLINSIQYYVIIIKINQFSQNQSIVYFPTGKNCPKFNIIMAPMIMIIFVVVVVHIVFVVVVFTITKYH